jgi:hypothetical protein
MPACLAGSACKLRLERVVLSLVKIPTKIPKKPNFAALKRLLSASQELAICPDVGLCGNRTRRTMALMNGVRKFEFNPTRLDKGLRIDRRLVMLSLTECVNAKLHMQSCDETGCCIHCGSLLDAPPYEPYDYDEYQACCYEGLAPLGQSHRAHCPKNGEQNTGEVGFRYVETPGEPVFDAADFEFLLDTEMPKGTDALILHSLGIRLGTLPKPTVEDYEVDYLIAIRRYAGTCPLPGREV